MKTTYSLACLLFAGASLIRAQGAPGSQNHPPVVNPDLSVTFTIEEPNAKEVRFFGDFGGGGQMPLMTKGDGNLWTFTTPPADPGTYHYSFLVDGVLTPDPSNIHARDWRNFIPWVSIVEVRGSDPFLYDPSLKVPHGTLRVETFSSAVLNACVPLYVYTPPGYDTSDKHYPVLFLLHGNGGTASQWSSDGRMEHLADNLIAAGRMPETILVAPDANVPGNSLALFEKYMVEELIPHIDASYRTLATQQSRGIIGQSRGGNQAFHVVFKHPELFSSLGIFHNALPALNTQTYASLQDAATVNQQVPLIVLNGAMDDVLIAFKDLQAAHNRLDQLGVAHTYQVFAGDHSWFNFRREFVDFAGRL